MNSLTKRRLRRRLHVDRDLRRGLVLRAITQWYFYSSAILLFVCLGCIWYDPSQLAIVHVYRLYAWFAPAILASLLLLPLVIYDLNKSANRIAGPIYRLRNEMQKLAAGQDVRELRFRDHDHWGSLAEDFNELARAVMAERRAVDEADPVSPADIESKPSPELTCARRI